MVDRIDKHTIGKIVSEDVAKEAQLMTDQAGHYVKVGRAYAANHVVNHGKGEYVSRTYPEVATNTVEGCFGVFKRGMKGIFPHCGEQHLQRYLEGL